MMHGMEGLLPVSARIAGDAVSAGLEGVVLAGGVALALRLAPRLTAAARAAIWSGVLLVVVLLHGAPLAEGSPGAKALLRGEGTMHADVRWSVALACVWAGCSLVRGARLAMSAVRLRRIARGATAVKVDAACTRLLHGRGRRAELCVSDAVDRPSVAGFLHPRILLPPELLTRLSPAELRQIVVHEMEHLRRRDDWVNLLQKLCLVVFPLNPALLWVERRVCAERELACDDRVLRLTRAPKTYATCLTNLAEHRLVRRGVSLALGAWERQTELAARVHRILAGPEPATGSARTRVATGLVALGMVAGGAALARSPQWVSFAPPIVEEHAGGMSLPEPGLLRTDFGAATARPMLVKAVMPELSRPLRSAEMRAHSRRPVRSGVRRRQGSRTVRGVTPMMLTNWNAGSTPKGVPRMTREVRVSFAAVPFGDGWLIVQL